MMQSTVTIDPQVFRSTMGRYPTGVCIVTSADDDGRPVGGMTAGTFTSVSLDPPLVAFMPAKTSTSWPLIRETGRFCINVLSAEQEGLCRSFSVSGADKFAGVEWHRSPMGLPVIDGSVVYIDCKTYDVVDAGDHLIVLGEVMTMDAVTDAEPLVFQGGKFHRPMPI